MATLILSFLQGLFAQGIGQSGSALSPWAFDSEPEINARKIAAFAGEIFVNFYIFFSQTSFGLEAARMRMLMIWLTASAPYHLKKLTLLEENTRLD